MVKGIIGSYLINLSKILRNPRPMGKEKNLLFDTKDYVLDLLTVRQKEYRHQKKAVISCLTAKEKEVFIHV